MTADIRIDAQLRAEWPFFTANKTLANEDGGFHNKQKLADQEERVQMGRRQKDVPRGEDYIYQGRRQRRDQRRMTRRKPVLGKKKRRTGAIWIIKEREIVKGGEKFLIISRHIFGGDPELLITSACDSAQNCDLQKRFAGAFLTPSSILNELIRRSQ